MFIENSQKIQAEHEALAGTMQEVLEKEQRATALVQQVSALQADVQDREKELSMRGAQIFEHEEWEKISEDKVALRENEASMQEETLGRREDQLA